MTHVQTDITGFNYILKLKSSENGGPVFVIHTNKIRYPVISLIVLIIHTRKEEKKAT